MGIQKKLRSRLRLSAGNVLGHLVIRHIVLRRVSVTRLRSSVTWSALTPALASTLACHTVGIFSTLGMLENVREESRNFRWGPGERGLRNDQHPSPNDQSTRK